jgi:hypothetical protein
VREDRECFAFPVLLLKRAEQPLAAAGVRRNRTAASEKAHFRWTVPILAPLVPSVLPADLLLARDQPQVGGQFLYPIKPGDVMNLAEDGEREHFANARHGP